MEIVCCKKHAQFSCIGEFEIHILMTGVVMGAQCEMEVF